jgi:rhamnose utilization protein RhaD (predicted bifunctional aldolase and dehydrogenase)
VKIPAPQLEQLLKASQYAAKNILLVQGRGGNSSVKSANGDCLWVKASGLRMSEVGPSRGYVEVKTAPWLEALRRPSPLAPGMTAAEKNGLRPSMEVAFHVVLGAVVLHTHPVYINAFACMESGREALEEVSPEKQTWIDYVPPGMELAAEIYRCCSDRKPQGIVLANHGFIASGDSADQVIASTEQAVDAARRYFGELTPDMLTAAPANPKLARWAEQLESALRRRDHGTWVVRPACWQMLNVASAEWLAGGPLVPDDVIYGPEEVFVLNSSQTLERWVEQNSVLHGRALIVVGGLGLLLLAQSAGSIETMEENLLANVLVRILIERRGRVRELLADQARHLREMESEKYRQAMVAGCN